MMDSVTRFAMAQREVGLAIGEPPATRGYTPWVFALLPQAARALGHQRATARSPALYTVLVDGDDMNEPVADAVRSILDGHIVLTRELAHAGHYPAIDVLQSVSRLEGEIGARRAEPPSPRPAGRLPRQARPDRDRRLRARHRPARRPRDRAQGRHRRLPAPAGRRAVDAEDADEQLLSLLAGDIAAGLAAEVAAEVAPELVPSARAMAYPPSGPVALPPLNLGV